MRNLTDPTVLFVPGLREHVPAHWQALLEQKLPNSRAVPRMAQNKLSCAAWVEQLDLSLAAISGPVILVAHSAGVLITVHWARHYRRRILGALLATPPDFETPLPAGYPAPDELQRNGWLPTPRARLPFPSIVAASTNDPLGSFERVAALASAWGSQLVNLGNVGHLNPASGYGEWPRAEVFIRELVGPHALSA